MKNCPYCGKKEELQKRPFVGSFCADCYVANRRIYQIKTPVFVERCSKCRRIRISGKWVEQDKEAIAGVVEARVRSSFPFKVVCKAITSEGKNLIEAGIEAKFEVSPSVFVSKEIRALVDVRPNTCTECARRSGGYFEAIIQLRGPEAKVQREARQLGRLVEHFKSFVAKVEVLREGVDLYVGDDRAARLALTQQGMHWTHSAKLAGMKEGKKLLRRSYCVRL